MELEITRGVTIVALCNELDAGNLGKLADKN